MRKNFAQVLKSAKIDIEAEYKRLYGLLYQEVEHSNYIGNKIRYYDVINENFTAFWFRGTSLTLDDFNSVNEFKFDYIPQNLDINYLVNFCEYLYNLSLVVYNTVHLYNNYASFVMEQIRRVIESIGYEQSQDNGIVIFVEKSVAAISVSETLPQPLSYKVIAYNHHSMRGNIESKKAILLQLSNLLESKRKHLHSVNSALEDLIFYSFNNLNLRHNNVDETNKSKYKKFIAEMSQSNLENYYDELYQMCLLAFLEIEQIERTKIFNELKSKIEKI